MEFTCIHDIIVLLYKRMFSDVAEQLAIKIRDNSFESLSYKEWNFRTSAEVEIIGYNDVGNALVREQSEEDSYFKIYFSIKKN